LYRYPGVACDVPAIFYSFSFAPNPKWTSFYPPGPEIYNYVQDVCDRFNLTDKIGLNTDIRKCRWLKDEEVWEVQVAHMKPGMGDLSSKERARLVREQGEDSVWTSTEMIRCKILISGVGGLVEPRAAPDDVPGFDKFKGTVFHSARWDYNVDFKDKEVVVLGTGCSSAQLVPRLVREPFNAKSVTQVMRSPPWVVAKAIPPGKLYA
jgi:cation diffusion facilitator CzcD-associated flavoprotein CzcO